MTAAPRDLSSDEILQRILTSLDDDKAEDVVTIDLRGRSAMADHMVIASGRNARQVATIAEKLAQRLKDATGRWSGNIWAKNLFDQEYAAAFGNDPVLATQLDVGGEYAQRMRDRKSVV